MLRLITIPISHYCERARWALDLSDIGYREDHHLQLFSRRVVKKLGGRGPVPVAIDETDGTLYGDSQAIVDLAADRGAPLYPRSCPEARALGEELAGAFGVRTRRLSYAGLLVAPEVLFRYNGGHAPLHERAAVRVGFPILAPKIKKRLGITRSKVDAAREQVRQVFDDMAARLESSAFLAGERFSVADLTFAALAAPLLLPSSYGSALPTLAEVPAEYGALVARFREHPAGAFALRMYAEHRVSVGRP